MEKYGTYKVYKHKITGEIKRVSLNSEDLEKVSEDSNQWEELEYEPGTVEN